MKSFIFFSLAGIACVLMHSGCGPQNCYYCDVPYYYNGVTYQPEETFCAPNHLPLTDALNMQCDHISACKQSKGKWREK